MLTSGKRFVGGFSLVELLVGITVGLFVVLAMTTVYINSLRGSTDSSNANRLNQDLRAVMDIMVSDVRRAGYWDGAVSGATNPFSVATTDINISAGCILYSYDARYLGGTAGVADAGTDFFGFRLNGNAVQMVSDNAMNDTSVACSDITWSNLTDPAALQISGLTFDTISSQCIVFDGENFDPATIVAPAFPGSSTYGAWWSVTSGSTRACDSPAPGGVVIPATADTRVEVRQINITLTGEIAGDATLQRTLTESVVVRNNRIVGS